MRRIKCALLVIAAGEILSSASVARAQATSTGPEATSAPDSHGPNGAGAPANPDPKPVAGSPEPGAQKGGSATASTSSGEGYTWHDKAGKPKHSKARSVKVDPNLAQASDPQFVVAEDGKTRISVRLSRKVEFHSVETRHGVVVEMSRSQVAILNDRNPLITTHFATPVVQARLVQSKKNVRLVIGLREPATPQIALKDAEAGAMVLEVILPKSSRIPATAHDSTRGHKRTRTRTQSRDTKEPSPNSPRGMGPRL